MSVTGMLDTPPRLFLITYLPVIAALGALAVAVETTHGGSFEFPVSSCPGDKFLSHCKLETRNWKLGTRYRFLMDAPPFRWALLAPRWWPTWLGVGRWASWVLGSAGCWAAWHGAGAGNRPGLVRLRPRFEIQGREHLDAALAGGAGCSC